MEKKPSNKSARSPGKRLRQERATYEPSTTEARWNQFLPYAILIDSEFREASDAAEIQVQEERLLAKLAEMRASLDLLEGSLEMLAGKLDTPPLGESTVAAIERLKALGNCGSPSDLLSLIGEVYPQPEALGSDMDLYRRLRQVSDFSAEILETRRYLDNAELRDGDSELAMDRASILEQLDLESLISSPHLWRSIKAIFDWFKQRYQPLYHAHHQSCNKELAMLHSRLSRAKPQLEALRWLNAIAELGEPVGEELFDDYEPLAAMAKPCPADDASVVTPEHQPVCLYCGLGLRNSPPTGEVEDFLARLGSALRAQQRRLSTEAIRQILAQSHQSQVDQFIKVVQTSDLASLANIMDEDLVRFLRELLSQPSSSPVLTEFKRRFPALLEGDIDRAVAEFANLLKEAFREAKCKAPGRTIRLSLE